MKVRVTLDVPDAVRRALRRRDGGRGVATRRDILKELFALWDAHTETLIMENGRPMPEEIEEGNEIDE